MIAGLSSPLQCCNFYSVKCEVLSKAFISLEEVNLDHSKLTAEQVSSLFETIVATEQLRLKTLCVAFVKFRSVPEEILKKAGDRVDIRTEIYFIREGDII